MIARGWRDLDVLLITGDAYFDHPSHGAAVIGRVLEARGYRVGIVARPDWRSVEPFRVMGRPTLFAGVTSGAVDSTLNNHTADLRRRRDDAYAPGGTGMGRPDLATVVYANRVREAFAKLPIVLGGIEASTRRFAYFDYLGARTRRSILVDSRADILVWGPGEAQAIEIADRLAGGRGLAGIPGTARLTRDAAPVDGVELPAFERLEEDPLLLVDQALRLERCAGPGFARPAYQRYREGVVICEARGAQSTADLDAIHSLPFTREAHPSAPGRIPALETVRWSVISHRGCPGGCSFCALAIHQGRRVTPRSAGSVLDEIRALARSRSFRGTISDVGGPTANAFGATPRDPDRCTRCERPSCFHPRICSNLEKDHRALLDLLEEASGIPGVKRILLASGIRHDLALADRGFIERICARHTGGHLKVAPEHVSPGVLELMRKPPIALLEEFERIFLKCSSKSNLEQYLVPYFIAGFPGCAGTDARAAGAWLSRRNQRLRQVQTFIPLPGTLAAAYYATGVDDSGAPLFVPDARERRRQKALLTGAPPSPRGVSRKGRGADGEAVGPARRRSRRG